MKSDPDREAVFGHGFADLIDEYDWDKTVSDIGNATADDVRRVINRVRRSKKPISAEELGILISPAAYPFVEEMAEMSRQITLERFGKTISLYIPMYVSNACTNKCVYCGFNHDNPFTRVTLTEKQIEDECRAIKDLGPFENLLIVAGEYPTICGVDYIERVLKVCRTYFHNLSIEVQPMRARDYKRLTEQGLYGVICFQETYNREAYKKYHPRGMKSHFDWRLNGFDRMGEAGVHKIGLGALLGLEDWRGDVVMMGRHLRYLQKKYWRSRYSVNFPRLCPSESGFKARSTLSDRDLVQLIVAFRLFDPDVDISISTRENSALRDNLIPLGVTSLSAGSKTEPGGYHTYPEALEQFSTNDERSPREVEKAIEKKGYQPVWKDWDAVMDKC